MICLVTKKIMHHPAGCMTTIQEHVEMNLKSTVPTGGIILSTKLFRTKQFLMNFADDLLPVETLASKIRCLIKIEDSNTKDSG